MVTEGGCSCPGGTFLSPASEPFSKLWEQEVFLLLLAECKNTQEVVPNIRSSKHSGVSLDQSVRLEVGDPEGVQRLIQYYLRCLFFHACFQGFFLCQRL